MREKNIMKSANFFCFVFYCTKRKMRTDKATIKSWNRGKVEIEEKPSIFKTE